MRYTLKLRENNFFLIYQPESENLDWIDKKIKKDGVFHRFGKVFEFTSKDVSLHDHEALLCIGKVVENGQYIKLEKSIFGIKNDFYILGFNNLTQWV